MENSKRSTLIDLREKSEWSRKEVAEMLNIAEITVRMIENGTRNPSNKLAMMFAYLYGVEVKDIFPDIFLLNDDTKRIIEVNKKRVPE